MFGPEADFVDKHQGYLTFQEAVTAYVRDADAPVPWNPFQRRVDDDAPARVKSGDCSALRTLVHEALFGGCWRQEPAGTPATEPLHFLCDGMMC